MASDPKISMFSSARANMPYIAYSVLQVLEFIKTDVYSKPVEAIRCEADKEKRNELKKKLPAITFAGIFTKRNSESLAEYSGIVCHDIDGLEPDSLQATRAQLIADPYVFSLFTSPSGNGLKVLFLSDHLHLSHLDVWEATARYLADKYSIAVDPSTKDICRLCFVSIDSDLYLNTAAEPVNTDVMTAPFRGLLKHQATPAVKPEMSIQPGKELREELRHLPDPLQEIKLDLHLAKCHEIVTRTVQPGDGQYNAYINQFAIQANRYGIDKDTTADAIAYYCGWPGPNKEDIAVINSVYGKFTTEWGKYLNPNTSSNSSKNTVQKQPKISPKNAPAYDEWVKFWYIVGRVDKSTGEVMTDANTGEPLGEYKYSYDDAITFLQNNGFYKYRAGEGYQFVHVDKENNLVELVNELRIKEFMIDYLKSQTTLEFKRVREMFRRGAKNYCSTGILEGLEYYNPELKRDTHDTAFVYFKNQYCEVNKHGIFPKPYKDQDGFIWRRQQLDVNYTEVDFKDSDVNNFIWYAGTGRKCVEAERTELEIQKYNALCTTIGYILHRYKSPVLTKAVIAVDKKLRRGSENNGRSGKSLFIKLISKMLNVVTIDGRNFGFDKDFNFQKVNIDTALINFDDVKPNFDFTRLFSMITEEFSFEKKRIDLITIPFSDAPKFFISSNSTLKGDGESSIARQQIVEFSTYFNASHTPAIEFGRMFFHDWDADEWQRYYCFMLHCIRLYLDQGLIAFPLENYGLNKLIDTAGEDFIDYMDEAVKANMGFGHMEFDSKLLFDKYVEIAKPKFPLKKNMFTKWVRMWADLNDLVLNGHKNGERDRRNGVDYLVFTGTNKEPATMASIDESGKLPF